MILEAIWKEESAPISFFSSHRRPDLFTYCNYNVSLGRVYIAKACKGDSGTTELLGFPVHSCCRERETHTLLFLASVEFSLQAPVPSIGEARLLLYQGPSSEKGGPSTTVDLNILFIKNRTKERTSSDPQPATAYSWTTANALITGPRTPSSRKTLYTPQAPLPRKAILHSWSHTTAQASVSRSLTQALPSKRTNDYQLKKNNLTFVENIQLYFWYFLCPSHLRTLPIICILYILKKKNFLIKKYSTIPKS